MYSSLSSPYEVCTGVSNDAIGVEPLRNDCAGENGRKPLFDACTVHRGQIFQGHSIILFYLMNVEI